MNNNPNLDSSSICLSRDVDALLIPTAVPITIPAKTSVNITQQLGLVYFLPIDTHVLICNAHDPVR